MKEFFFILLVDKMVSLENIRFSENSPARNFPLSRILSISLTCSFSGALELSLYSSFLSTAMLKEFKYSDSKILATFRMCCSDTAILAGWRGFYGSLLGSSLAKFKSS